MHFHKRIWATLNEPRAVTALMVGIYLLATYSGAVIVLGGTDSWLVCAGAGAMTLGGLFAAPAAWRGSWWLEGPAALLVSASYLWVATVEAINTVGGLHWPHHTVSTALIVVLFIGTRAARVWPAMYRPGVLPLKEVDKARASMENARAEEYAEVSFRRAG